MHQIADLIYTTRVLASESKKVDQIDNVQIEWLGTFQMESVLKEALLNIEAQESLKRVDFDKVSAEIYEQQKDQFLNDVEIHAAHILLNTRGKNEEEVQKQIVELREKALAENSDFLELAKEHSQDPSAKRNGGDLGFFKKGRMVKPFEDAAFSTPVGEISEPVKSKFGYHILKVLDKRGGDVKPFEEVKPAIISELKKQIASKYKVDRLNLVVESVKSKPSLEAVERIVAKYNKSQDKKD